MHKTEKLKKLATTIELLPKFWFGFGLSFHFIEIKIFYFGFGGRFVCTKSTETESNYILIYFILHIKYETRACKHWASSFLFDFTNLGPPAFLFKIETLGLLLFKTQ